jgi:hypothetical protein
MVIFIISAGICVFCLVLLVFGSASRENEAILKRLKKMTQATTRKVYSDEELYQPLTQRFLIPLLQIILTHVSAILPKSSNDKLAQQLLLSGSTINPREYQAMRFLVVLGTTLFFAGAGFLIQKDISVVFLFGIMGAIIGTLIMRFKLLGEIKSA